jgi:fluoride ion exporter CrcB/FEX
VNEPVKPVRSAISARLAALVFLGGALGTLARFELDTVLEIGPFLMFVNIIGSFILGAANRDAKGSPETRAFFGIGFAGGFTTMSGVSLLLLIADGSLPITVVYVIAMFGLSLVAYLVGMKLLSGAKK